mmetsp:Transcript_29696/g.55995  ORF Transcript_29696/g.55995 Transcript_29696/m.55995 type:complete len:327 (+) Transcript_29696:1757-2737(+)
MLLAKTEHTIFKTSGSLCGCETTFCRVSTNRLEPTTVCVPPILDFRLALLCSSKACSLSVSVLMLSSIFLVSSCKCSCEIEESKKTCFSSTSTHGMHQGDSCSCSPSSSSLSLSCSTSNSCFNLSIKATNSVLTLFSCSSGHRASSDIFNILNTKIKLSLAILGAKFNSTCCKSLRSTKTRGFFNMAFNAHPCRTGLLPSMSLLKGSRSSPNFNVISLHSALISISSLSCSRLIILALRGALSGVCSGMKHSSMTCNVFKVNWSSPLSSAISSLLKLSPSNIAVKSLKLNPPFPTRLTKSITAPCTSPMFTFASISFKMLCTVMLL